MKKIIVLIALVMFGVWYGYGRLRSYFKEPVPEHVSINEVIAANVTDDWMSDLTNESDVKLGIAIPEELNLDIQFYSQAPYGDWNYPWQEACEEASALLVANAYFERHWSVLEFNNELLLLIDWEKVAFGSYEHTNVRQTAQIFDDYLKLKTVIHEDPTFEDVQQILANGHLIVMTFSGKEINNPFYSNGGPVYHAMVIKGYTKDRKLVVHDVGTKRGEDYVYTWDVIESALHDYDVPIKNGAKRYIEILPPSGF
jgi:Peptidase_C39 like family